ncbi:response regulator [Oscillatoria sp. FACHB-1407]|uniref:response regulator transcription factor n=1 Tax=Oscillatoria sp. FACHB-1407 TaxID=2692847 RepID=UPI0016829020|nr:response regulator [Oscillatoria sp. FACHB-1407]MBD2465800.1 response regulator [Oscillatoria sp. FACHB-1407]
MSHVLLVDDEVALRESLTYTLQKEGFTVTTAHDGQSAIKQFHKQVPDIILLDIMLPEIDGMEICWRIRAFSNVPIVMLTAKDQDIDKVRGLEAGADDYVTKPFNTRELMARIKAVLRRHNDSKAGNGKASSN